MLATELIIDKIKTTGPISFKDFMDICLYYPGAGYYTSGENKTGASGDYYTAPFLSTAFGNLLAVQLEEMDRIINGKSFTLVEYGAGNGMLCRDILHYFSGKEKLSEKLHYYILDKSNWSADLENQYSGTVTRINSLDEIGTFSGCVISNELLDNFAVHRVVMQDELMEIFVDYQDGFCETLQPAPQVLKNYLNQLGIELKKGHSLEINLQAIEWLKEVAKNLNTGFVITMDYGYLSNGYSASLPKEGTLRCYHQHSMQDDFYARPGQQDITAHVNFSALSHWGKMAGLETCGITEQGLFLRALGIGEYLRRAEMLSHANSNSQEKQRKNIYQLIIEMGHRIKVLIQKKGPLSKNLCGLSFSYPSIR